LFVVPFGVPEEAELVDEVGPVANVIKLFLRHWRRGKKAFPASLLFASKEGAAFLAGSLTYSQISYQTTWLSRINITYFTLVSDEYSFITLTPDKFRLWPNGRDDDDLPFLTKDKVCYYCYNISLRDLSISSLTLPFSFRLSNFNHWNSKFLNDSPRYSDSTEQNWLKWTNLSLELLSWADSDVSPVRNLVLELSVHQVAQFLDLPAIGGNYADVLGEDLKIKNINQWLSKSQK